MVVLQPPGACDGVVVDRQGAVARGELLQRHPGLQPCQRGAQAEMDAVPEGQLRTAAEVPPDVEAVGLGVRPGVPVDREQPRHDERVRGNRHPAHLGGAQCRSSDR